MKNKILVILCILVVLGGIVFKVLNSPCRTDNSNKLFSQDGAYSVQASDMNCHATTPYVTDIIITHANSYFSNLGVVSVWLSNKKDVFSFNGVKSSVKLFWLDKRTLKISYNDCREIYSQDKYWKDIKILYEGKCAAHQ